MQQQNKLTHTKFNINLRVQEGVHNPLLPERIVYIFWIFFQHTFVFSQNGPT